MTVLFFSDIPWSALYQRPQQLASLLAKKCPVLWIEPATLGSTTYWSPAPIQPNLYRLSLPQFPFNARSTTIKKIARIVSMIPGSWWVLAHVQRVLLWRAFAAVHVSETVAMVQNFQFATLIRSLGCNRIVFDYIDDIFGFTEFPAAVTEQWKHMIGRADEVTTTSPVLMQQIMDQGRSDVRLLSNGVNYSLFSSNDWQTQRPTDLPKGDAIAMYIGSVYPWFDFELMEYLLTHMPDINFVLVGHEHPEVRDSLIRMQKLPNFHFLGVRPYELLPGYLASAHVGIIPFRRTPLTAAVNPVKLYEYSAAGVPTVTTDFSTELPTLGVPVLVAPTAPRFALFIREAQKRYADPVFRERLRGFARENDWNHRGEEIASLLGIQTDEPIVSEVL